MRALRERPRVTVAKALAFLVVFGAGAGFASLLSDDEPAVPPATATALERARSAADDRAGDLTSARGEVERLEDRVAALERRLRASGSRNRRLVRALRGARRRLAQLQP